MAPEYQVEIAMRPLHVPGNGTVETSYETRRFRRVNDETARSYIRIDLQPKLRDEIGEGSWVKAKGLKKRVNGEWKEVFLED